MSTLIALLVALAPGTYAWISGRKLVTVSDDPSFADMYFARSRMLGMLAIACVVVSGAASGGGYWWTTPVTIVGLYAGAFPSRRVLFGETWSLPRYLSFWISSLVGMVGFWALLFLSPVLIDAVAGGDWRLGAGAAALLAIILILINQRYPRFWLATHRATPLIRIDLDPHFEAIIARASCARPDVYRFGESGGHVMNALALPAAERPAVAFGDAVLERLDPDEIAAVFAHEVAHLEHFSGKRLKQMWLATVGLILFSTTVPVALMVSTEWLVPWTALATGVLALLLLSRIIGKSQANETASDLRAAELTGDPEAVIRALTKLHLHLRLPRQWPQETEPTLSHPSLARRIQAIRHHANLSGPSLELATVVRSTRGGARVALDDQRAYWFDSVSEDVPNDLAALRERASTYRAHAYTELSELRLVAAGKGRALKARDLDGNSWAIAVRAEDVPMLQRALEAVDARLGQRRAVRSASAARLVAAGVLVAMLAAGQPAILLVPVVVTLLRPGTAALAALCAMVLAQAAVAILVDGGSGASVGTLAGLAGMVLFAGAAALLAWRGARQEVEHSSAKPTLLSLAGAGIIALLLLLAGAKSSTAAALLAEPMMIAFALSLLGTATALAMLGRRRWQRVGVSLALLSLVGVVAGASSASAAHGTPLPIVQAEARHVADIALPRPASRVELSPLGGHYAVQLAEREGAAFDEQRDSFVFAVGRIDGPSRELEAIEILLLDETRLLTLARRGDSLEVRLEAIDGRALPGAWHHALPRLYAPMLLVDRAAHRWSLIARGEMAELVAHSGSLDGGTIAERRWGRDSSWTQPLWLDTDGSLLSFSLSAPTSALGVMMGILGGTSLRFDLWRIGQSGRTLVAAGAGHPQCRADGVGAVCIAGGTDRTRVWRYAGGAAEVLGTLPIGYDVRHVGQSGGVVALSRDGHSVLIVETQQVRALRVGFERRPGQARGDWVMDARAAGGTLATLEYGGDSARLGIWTIVGLPLNGTPDGP